MAAARGASTRWSSTRCATGRIPTHFTVAQAIEVAARIGARATWFTHICHDLPHAATCARLPAGVQLAYDGLVLDIRDDAAGSTR